MCCLLIQRTKKACDFGDKLSLRMILGSQSTYTLLNCSKWLEGRQPAKSSAGRAAVLPR